MDARMLDGNAIAGLLREVFAVEMTTARGTCAACGASEPVGATRVFRGAGIVLRCPHCDSALLTIVKRDSGVWIGFSGIRMLQVAVERPRSYTGRREDDPRSGQPGQAAE